MAAKFSAETFKYFDGAVKNRKKEEWFRKNESLYRDHVLAPFTILIQRIDLEIGDSFPKLSFEPRKIMKPLYRKNNIPDDGTVVKPQASAFFSETATSMYEWNPGVYFSFGESENILGLGLYMMSSRQIKLLRRAISDNPDEISELLNNKKLKSLWGELQGEKYVRFPKEYDPNAPGSEYLWFKQFYLGKELTRKVVTSKTFFDDTVERLKVAAPFLSWVRSTVGTYSKPSSGF